MRDQGERAGIDRAMELMVVSLALAGGRTAWAWLAARTTPPIAAGYRDAAFATPETMWATGERSVRVRLVVDANSSRYRAPFTKALAEDGPFATKDDFLRLYWLAVRECHARADGILFVAESQRERREALVERLERLRTDLVDLGRDPAAVPVVFALNKRDLPGVMPVDDMKSLLTWPRCAYVETEAVRGRGLPEAMARLIELVEAGA